MSPDPPKRGCHGSDDTDDDNCPSPPSSHGSRHLVTPLVVTAFVLVFLSLASLSIYCFIRRRRRRRRQQSLLAAGAANPGAQGDGPAPEIADTATATDVEVGAAGPEDEVVHHAWHIRTVGLDERAIESIALTRYRADAGTLGGAADCSVCLGEFLDGELLRLLPKCGHAFHVPCIGTWLRAHVNCPLCRADVVVLDSAATGGSDPPAEDAQQVPSTTETLNHEQPSPAQQLQNEQQELSLQIDRSNRSRSPEPQRRRMQSFRRVASMDLSLVSAGAGLAPEDKRSSAESQGNGEAASGEVPSGSGRLRYLSGVGRRSLLSRHRRTSSSMLPS